jgi:small subunit ribosomal protein S21
LAEVRLQEGESLENALRRFKRKVQQEDIIKEVKRHSFYLKPGEKKRVKAALARKRARKKTRKEQGECNEGPLRPGAALLDLAPTMLSCIRDFISIFFPA